MMYIPPSLVLLVEDNASQLYTTGLNNYGQLGLGDTVNRSFLSPVTEVDDSVHFTQVKGGVHHSLALTSEGHVFAWGRGDSGQLG